MTTRLLMASALLLLAACSSEDGVVIAPPENTDEFLTVMERFETAYVGQWEEDGNCSGSDRVLDIGEDNLRLGELYCADLQLSMGTARVRAMGKQCRSEGQPDSDRTYVLDLAGSDILYVEADGDPRERFERCEG